MRRIGVIICSAILALPTLTLGQPPKKSKPPNVAPVPKNNLILNDTLVVSYDTTKVQFRVWTGGNDFDYANYLTRVNGYMITVKKQGKYTSEQPRYTFFDWRWKELRPEEIEGELSKKVQWKQKE